MYIFGVDRVAMSHVRHDHHLLSYGPFGMGGRNAEPTIWRRAVRTDRIRGSARWAGIIISEWKVARRFGLVCEARPLVGPGSSWWHVSGMDLQGCINVWFPSLVSLTRQFSDSKRRELWRADPLRHETERSLEPPNVLWKHPVKVKAPDGGHPKRCKLQVLFFTS